MFAMDRSDAVRRARTWWSAVSDTSYVPMSSRDAKDALADLLVNLADALDAEQFDPTVGAEVGSALVRMRLTNPVVVARSAEVLAELPRLSESGTAFFRSKYAALMGSFGQGYAAALQADTLSDQQAIQATMSATHKQTEQAAKATDTRFRVVFDNAAVAIAIGDLRGVLVDVNPAMAQMLGQDAGELRGASAFDLGHADDYALARRRILDELIAVGSGTIRLEARFRRGDGSYGWAMFAITLVAGDGDVDSYLLAVGEDITERREMQAALYRQSRHDPLTGLPNRLLLHEDIADAIDIAEPDDHIGLCFLDLDGFKYVNDQFGHATGDRLLAAVAARLQEQATADGYVVARLGGDEFVAVMAAPVDNDAVTAAASRLLASIKDPFEVDGHKLSVSASIGVVAQPVFGADADAILETADVALYRAKADGGAGFFVHEPTPS